MRAESPDGEINLDLTECSAHFLVGMSPRAMPGGGTESMHDTEASHHYRALIFISLKASVMSFIQRVISCAMGVRDGLSGGITLMETYGYASFSIACAVVVSAALPYSVYLALSGTGK